MDFDQSLELLDEAVSHYRGRGLSDAETAILQGVWQGQTYQKIAETFGYSSSYLSRDLGPKFWKMLSVALGETVGKKNIHSVVSRWCSVQQQSHTVHTDPSQRPPENNSQSPNNRSTPELKFVARSGGVRCDWGEAPDVSFFGGREEELRTLTAWLRPSEESQARACRLVALLGIGGVGKTALSVKLAQQIQHEFDCVIWRSLRNAPRLDQLLGDLIPFLSHQQETDCAVTLLLHWLRQSRCLVILDNMETILKGGAYAGQFRDGYEDYSNLLQIIGEASHQSCLLLTSREKLAEIATFEGSQSSVKSLQLSGSPEVALALIETRQLSGSQAEKEQLAQRYSYSPLALQIVCGSIRDVFAGDISLFIEQDTFLFNGVNRLLDQQFERITPLEKTVMCWLAINRDWISIDELMADIYPPCSKMKLLETLESLCWRSLIETKSGQYTQQPVVMEYVTTQLIQQATESILQNQIGCLSQYPLVQAQAPVSVYDTQKNLILQPIVDDLLAYFRTPIAIVKHLYSLLTGLRSQSAQSTGYFCGNLLHFAKHLEVDISGYDFSGLTIWQANLQGMPLHNTNFCDADFCDATFSEILDEVNALAFSPNGQCLVIVDQDCKVRVWCTRTYQQLWVCHEHQNSVLSVAFSPDSQFLVSASADQTLKLWNADTGTCLHTFIGHQSEVCAVAFSPTGQHFASGSKDTTIKVWDIASGQCQQTLSGHHQAVFTIAFSTDGSLIASGSSDKTIKLWNVETGICQQTLQGHTNWVMSVTFSPHTQRLASCSTDKTIKLWDYNSGECTQTLHGHRNWVISLAFSPDGSQLVSSSGDQTAKLWVVSSGTCIQTFSGHNHSIFAIAFHPQGNLVASGSLDQTVRLWNTDTGACLKVLTGYTNRIFAVACSADGYTLASGSFDQSIRLWDRQQGRVVRSLKGHHHPVYSLAFSPKDQSLASGGGDYTIKLWHYPTGQCLSTLSGHRGWVYALAYSPDGEWLVSGASDHAVKVWRVSTGDCVMTLTGHQTWIWSVAVSPDGKMLASGSGDRTIKLWEAQTGQCLHTLTGHTDRVYSVAFSPEGQSLASGGFDHTIKIWKVETGECLQSLTGHTNGVYTVVFSPDGKILASGSLDHTIKLWNLSTGECLGTFTGHENQVRSLVFLPPLSATDDAQLQLASGSQDQTLRIWQVQTGECQRVLRVKPLYDGMNITGTTGLTTAQKASLKALGAVEQFGDNV